MKFSEAMLCFRENLVFIQVFHDVTVNGMCSISLQVTDVMLIGLQLSDLDQFLLPL